MSQLILAYYFPQYHSIPENDEIFGENFNDWNLFKEIENVKVDCKLPLDPPIGLGYYDPTLIDVRIKQAVLAKKYGVDGFIYYHYWLENHPVMSKVLDNLVNDNEPNIPFCICFANESWKHSYGNKEKIFKSLHKDGSTFRQLYDDQRSHAQYLQKIFKHKNYIRINNSPILFLYQLSPQISIYLNAIIIELKKYNIDNIYIIANTSYHCLRNYKNENLIRMPDAYSPFIAHEQKKLPTILSNLPCIYGGLMGWNATLRNNNKIIINYTPDQIVKNVCKDLILMRENITSPQIYALFAWNEWAEGAMIEPNNIYGEELGNAIKKGREISEMLYTDDRFSNLVFKYGYGETFIDITKHVYLKCIESIEEKTSDGTVQKKWIIFIPKGDNNRNKLFTDIIYGINKVIKITKNEIETIYDQNIDIVLPIT